MPTLAFALANSLLISPNSRSSYFYLFDHKPQTKSQLDFGPDWLKTSANHADEIPFLFPYFLVCVKIMNAAIRAFHIAHELCAHAFLCLV